MPGGRIVHELNDSRALMASMILILAIGIFVDTLVFAPADKAIRRRHGLLDRAR